MLPVDPWYREREQSYLKHYVLEEYLVRFGRIIGSRWNTINYLDTFAGPWEERHPDLADTSFAIAVEAFRDVRRFLQHERGRELRVRALFLEKDADAYTKLRAYTNSIDDISAVALQGEFESKVPELVSFVKQAPAAFTFTFIDPKGWKEIAIELLRPILQIERSEVLINFMTSYIRRFLEDEKSAASFVRLFGSDIRPLLAGLSGDEREERAIREYMRSLKRVGNFLYVGSAIIFKPEIETPHFHLMYATRDAKGVEVFKEVEEKLFTVSHEVRASAKERRREARTGMGSLFDPGSMHKSVGLEDRRARYLTMAKARVRERLERYGTVLFDKLWRIALAYPLVWERDLIEWLETWQRAGSVRLPTITGRRRRPQRDRGDMVEWLPAQLDERSG